MHVVETHSVLVGLHRAAAHAHRRESAVVVEVLHRHLAREVREERQHVVGAVLGRGVAQRSHAVGERHQVAQPQHAASRGGRRRRLRHGVDPHVLLTAVDVAETAGDGLQQRLGVGHVVVAVERALGRDVRKRHDRTPVVDGVFLAGHLNDLVERNGRNVERLGEEIVIQIVVGAALADVGRHADRVEHEVELAAEMLHRLVDQVLQILDARGVGRNDNRIAFFGQLRDGSHADRYGSIGEDDFGSLLHGSFRHFPGDRLLVECSENQTFLSFQ